MMYTVQGTVTHKFETTVEAESESLAQAKVEAEQVKIGVADFTEIDDSPSVSNVEEIE